MLRTKSAAIWVLAGSAMISTYAFAAKVGGVSQKLQTDTEDSNTPEANATVWVGGCTGTLIQPDMVVTAGHCINRPSGFKAEDGRWYPVSQLVNNRPQTIGFGNDRRRFALTLSATHFSVLNGADIALLALERSVDPSIAKPAKVLTEEPKRIRWSSQTFDQAGWGLTSESGSAPMTRRAGTANFSSFPCKVDGVKQADKFCVSGTLVLGGDSGGPLYWRDGSGQRWLIGVVQGYDRTTGTSRYVPTFLPAGQMSTRADGSRYEEPDIATFFRTALEASACAHIKRQNATAASPTTTLEAWYSPSRGDNFVSTLGVWKGCYTWETRKPDYSYVRVEGIVFSPDRPRPAGTVPLFSWYSSSRGDNWTTSQHTDEGQRRQRLSPDYGFSRLEGYIYPPDHRAAEGIIPIYSWYSPSRKDNWTTTQFPAEGGARRRLSPDYGFVRLEGYILRP